MNLIISISILGIVSLVAVISATEYTGLKERNTIMRHLQLQAEEETNAEGANAEEVTNEEQRSGLTKREIRRLIRREIRKYHEGHSCAVGWLHTGVGFKGIGVQVETGTLRAGFTKNITLTFGRTFVKKPKVVASIAGFYFNDGRVYTPTNTTTRTEKYYGLEARVNSVNETTANIELHGIKIHTIRFEVAWIACLQTEKNSNP